MALGSNSTGNWEGYYMTLAEIAADPRVAVGYQTLMNGLSKGDYPPLKPDGRQFGKHVFIRHATVEPWIESLAKYREEAWERAAAKRAAKKAAEAAETARVMAANEREIAAMAKVADAYGSIGTTDAAERAKREQAQRDQMELAGRLYGPKG